jgi:parallel beta-helix repeat protein
MTGYDCGEIQQIRVIDDGTDFELYNPVWDDYTTANSARVYELHFLDNIVVDGITILRGGVDNSYGIGFRLVRNSIVQNCEIYAADGRGIEFNEVLYSTIHNNYIIDTNKDQLGYSIFIINASQFNHITGNFIKRCRRAVSFGGTNIPAGLPRFHIVEGNFFTGSAERTTPFLATHVLCEYVQIINNTFIGDGVRGGMSIESYHTLISGNWFKNCTTGITLHDGAFNAIVEENTIFGGNIGIWIRAGANNEERHLSISDNYITSVAGIQFQRYDGSNTTFKEVYIKDNIVNAGTYFMRGDAATTTLEDCQISGNITFGKPNLHMGDSVTPRAWVTDVIEVSIVKFDSVYAIGNSGATETIDWLNGAYQSITLDEACAISFSNEYVGTLHLEVTYGGTFALTFDGGVTLLEEGGVEIVTTDDTGVDILIFQNWGTADEYVMGALLDVQD